jgi:hypothetical protein
LHLPELNNKETKARRKTLLLRCSEIKPTPSGASRIHASFCSQYDETIKNHNFPHFLGSALIWFLSRRINTSENASNGWQPNTNVKPESLLLIQNMQPNTGYCGDDTDCLPNNCFSAHFFFPLKSLTI